MHGSVVKMVKGFGSDDCGPLTADLSAPIERSGMVAGQAFLDARPAAFAVAAAVEQVVSRPNAICYFCGMRVIKAPIFGVPIPVAKSYPGVAGNKPLLLVV